MERNIGQLILVMISMILLFAVMVIMAYSRSPEVKSVIDHFISIKQLKM